MDRPIDQRRDARLLWMQMPMVCPRCVEMILAANLQIAPPLRLVLVPHAIALIFRMHIMHITTTEAKESPSNQHLSTE